jgi:predicted negative regulator of RcsB-dependent stress response
MMQELLLKTVQGWVKELKQDKYSLAFTIALLVALAGFGLFKAKNWYVARQEGVAQIVFSEALDEYDRVVYSLKKGGLEKHGWQDAQLAFKAVQENHKGTTYAVYAQAFEADTLAREGKYIEAIQLLEAAISQMAAKAPALYQFKTKVALLKLDAGQTDVALADLKMLAQDADNANSDTAAFFLGYYFWVHDKFNEARSAWERFEKGKQPKDAEKVSPWAVIAQTKLAQIA